MRMDFPAKEKEKNMHDLLSRLPKDITCIEKKYQKGDTIINPDRSNNFFYILTAGKAAVYNLGTDGEELNLYDYRAGDCFGEIELLCGKRYPLLIRAKSRCTVFLVAQPNFLQWLRKDSEFSLFLLRRMSEKLLENAERMTKLSMFTMKERYFLSVHSHLIAGDLAALTKIQIAEEIHAPLRSLNRLVAENSSLVRYGKNGFRLVDQEGLEHICEQLQMMLWQHGSP